MCATFDYFSPPLTSCLPFILILFTPFFTQIFFFYWEVEPPFFPHLPGAACMAFMSISVCFTLRQTVAGLGLGAKSLIKLKCMTLAKGLTPHSLRHAAAMSYCDVAFGTAFIWFWHIHFAMATDGKWKMENGWGMLCLCPALSWPVITPPSWFRTHWLVLEIHFNVEIIIALVVFSMRVCLVREAPSWSWQFVWHLAVEIKSVQATRKAEQQQAGHALWAQLIYLFNSLIKFNRNIFYEFNQLWVLSKSLAQLKAKHKNH